jgi:hypothetical protein
MLDVIEGGRSSRSKLQSAISEQNTEHVDVHISIRKARPVLNLGFLCVFSGFSLRSLRLKAFDPVAKK